MQDDLISRQAVLDYLKANVDDFLDYHEAIEEVLNMPSVAIPSKTGHWITKPNVYGVTYCSECDFELKIDDTNYCPRCGADMRGGQDDNRN